MKYMFSHRMRLVHNGKNCLLHRKKRILDNSISGIKQTIFVEFVEIEQKKGDLECSEIAEREYLVQELLDDISTLSSIGEMDL